jgi:hypothetical protein
LRRSPNSMKGSEIHLALARCHWKWHTPRLKNYLKPWNHVDIKKSIQLDAKHHQNQLTFRMGYSVFCGSNITEWEHSFMRPRNLLKTIIIIKIAK